jgi:hypothetical protein
MTLVLDVQELTNVVCRAVVIIHVTVCGLAARTSVWAGIFNYMAYIGLFGFSVFQTLYTAVITEFTT